MAKTVYFYTGIGSSAPYLYSKERLVSLLEEVNHLLSSPFTYYEFEDEDYLIGASGALLYKPANDKLVF
jgi:hypothetical protein